MPQRYCTNCGASLPEDARFCGSCGRASHETAAVATPEADVPVPPLARVAQPPTPSVGAGRGWSVGAMVTMAAAFLFLFLVAAAKGIASAAPLGIVSMMIVGTVTGLVAFVLVAALVSFLAGVYWITGRKDGVTFAQALFNWPMSIIVCGMTLLGMLL